MKRSLLRIDQSVIGERQQCKLTGRSFRFAVNIGVMLARQLSVGGFDLSGGRRLLNAQDLVVIGHRKGNQALLNLLKNSGRSRNPAGNLSTAECCRGTDYCD